MTPAELSALLDRLIADWENEVVEFKDANDNYPTSDIGKYFSALANEANLRNAEWGWLVFGVNDRSRSVVGTDYRRDPDRLQSLKQQVLDGTEPRASFRDIHVLALPAGRIVLMQVPAAPRGIPISWQGHYYARAGESLTPLPLDKLDTIRSQGAGRDWSAVVVPDASVGDLDPQAIKAARTAFSARHAARVPPDEVAGWSDVAFLERARLTSREGITRACLLLLGRPESSSLLSPLLAEMTWKLAGPERAYEHFGLPFLLSTTRVYERIRNVQIRMMQPNSLIQTEIAKYDRKAVLEAVHNCIAHADYATRGSRIVVTEHIDRIVLENDGSFIDGPPEDYVLGVRTPRTYRNPFLVDAMTELNMIDRMGYGLAQIHLSQRARFLPLPDYDLSEPGTVRVTIYGAVLDPNFSQLLMARTDLPLADVLALDRVQKHRPISDDALRRLRRARLVEGRRPNLRVSATVADATEARAEYIRTRPQSDEHYAKLLLDYLEAYGSATRRDIDSLLMPLLSSVLSEQQQRDKVKNLLSKMREAGAITNSGSRRQPLWVRVDDGSVRNG